ncbi:hypothetical protein CERZMDRAFT_92981 [Cercospora zeae-maydis SCOH1-5]|uniref:Uncharacterized protein n=1 Tax=Cercospora zeae-maydis SCOH1-5 TaxID=717836 RepID=A0A6A6FUH3_9PEZI|nr:hypothetical protein CERZMDRAFT_92981 [Cercospora zeae-maydis SCOH1-5]
MRDDSPDQLQVYHAVNPRPTPWQSLLPAVQYSLAVEKTVPFEEWIDKLTSLEDQDINRYPAVKLANFYRSLLAAESVGLDTRESRRASWILNEMKPVTGDMLNPEVVLNWLCLGCMPRGECHPGLLSSAYRDLCCAWM